MDIPSSFNKQGKRKSRGPSVKWTAEMTTVLVREVVKAVRSGKRSDGGFKTDVWNEISLVVLRRCAPGEPLTGDKCQGKLENLRKKWNIWVRLKTLSGFGWDEERGIVTAPEEVWAVEIAVSCHNIGSQHHVQVAASI